MKTYSAPARRNIVHLHAKMKSGAGTHKTNRKDGPTVDDWEDDLPSWRDNPPTPVPSMNDPFPDGI